MQAPFALPITQDAFFGCWLWIGPLDRDGYAMWRGRRMHPVIWIDANGPIDAGKQLDHLCRRRNCVNPAHLEMVTKRENIRRIHPSRWRRERCIAGHELYHWGRRTPQGGVVCRLCMVL